MTFGFKMNYCMSAGYNIQFFGRNIFIRVVRDKKVFDKFHMKSINSESFFFWFVNIMNLLNVRTSDCPHSFVCCVQI